MDESNLILLGNRSRSEGNGFRGVVSIEKRRGGAEIEEWKDYLRLVRWLARRRARCRAEMVSFSSGSFFLGDFFCSVFVVVFGAGVFFCCGFLVCVVFSVCVADFFLRLCGMCGGLRFERMAVRRWSTSSRRMMAARM